jgi:hypothetical protein
MGAGVYDLSIEQGTSFSMVVTFEDSNGDPINLSGYSGRGQIRAAATATSVLASFTVTITDAANGEVTIALDPEDSSAIPVKGKNYSEKTEYVYDIELYTVGGEVIRLLNGKASISPEVTK